jgi:Gpi18-like mannosyltransferase
VYTWIVYGLLFIAFVALMPSGGYPPDIECWRRWTLQVLDNGLGSAYQSGTDYMPLHHYILWIYGKTQGTALAITNHINGLKVITLVFHFISGLIIVRLLRDTLKSQSEALVLSLLFLLNIAYLYNTMMWGQADSIFACFVFASLYAAKRERVGLSLLLFVLALNLKLQAIVFAPLVGLALLPSMAARFSWPRLGLWVLVAVGAQMALLLPYWIEGDLDLLWKAVGDSTNRYPFASMNAHNMWYFVFEDPAFEPDDGLTWIGILIFFLLAAVALLPLTRKIYHRLFTTRPVDIRFEQVLLAGTLCGLLFFFFNTQMHERYSHPALLLLAAYALLTAKFVPYVLVSVAYFLNMDAVLDHFHASWLPYDPRINALIYFAAIVLLFADLYHLRLRRRPVLAHRPNSSL